MHAQLSRYKSASRINIMGRISPAHLLYMDGIKMYVPKSPLVLGVQITDRCNLNCPHCNVDANQKGRSLPQDIVLSIIDEAVRIGVKELILGGGEVLLYDDFFIISDFALSKGLNLSFSSNGLLIPEKIHQISKLQKYNTIIRVGISLDGPTPEIHGYFRPIETYESALNAIQILQKSNISTHVLCVLNKSNINFISDYLKFLANRNIYNVRFIPFMPTGRGKKYKDEMLTPDQFYNILNEKQKMNENYGINIGLSIPWDFLLSPPEKRVPHPCEAGYLRLWINSNGDMFPCSYMSDIPIGNIYHDSIGDAWLNSSIMKKFRDPGLLKGACATCDYRDSCRGGCRGLAYFLEGDYLCADPYCQHVRQKKLQ